MHHVRESLRVFAAVIVFTLCVISASRAELSQSDIREINQYKMTEQGMNKFFQATTNLVPVVHKYESVENDSEESEDTENLTKLVQQFDAIPGAKKAVEDAGMTTREYLTFQIGLVYAASGQVILKSGAQLPAEYSKEHVEFFRAHEAEFKKHQADFEIVRQAGKEGNDKDEDQ